MTSALNVGKKQPRRGKGKKPPPVLRLVGRFSNALIILLAFKHIYKREGKQAQEVVFAYRLLKQNTAKKTTSV